MKKFFNRINWTALIAWSIIFAVVVFEVIWIVNKVRHL